MAKAIGSVTALVAGSPPLVTVTYDDGVTENSFPYLASYQPAVGDTVHSWVEKGDHLVLGTVDASDSAAAASTQVVQITANTGSTSAGTGLTVTGITPLQVRSGHRYRADAGFRSLQGDTAGDVYSAFLEIVDDTTLVQVRPTLDARNIRIQTSATGQDGAALWAWFDVDSGDNDLSLPHATGYRLRLRLQRVAGSGTAFVQANAAYPCRVMVTDLGVAG